MHVPENTTIQSIVGSFSFVFLYRSKITYRHCFPQTSPPSHQHSNLFSYSILILSCAQFFVIPALCPPPPTPPFPRSTENTYKVVTEHLNTKLSVDCTQSLSFLLVIERLEQVRYTTAREWSERGRWPRREWGREKSLLPILRAAVPLARSSLSATVDEKKGLRAV